ncbi:hypothetical protein AB0D49_32675 [Streptomyces sp. NPDC048290]|uniref:hypothetical protein n=1 Tax=Streptomyces sp. NPDC048290 TaxID=3155811 RepID=UPI00343E059C
MRRLLAALLAALVTPRRPGRHSAEYLAAVHPLPDPAPPARWNGPSAREVRAIFSDERVLHLPPPQRERHYAHALAALGVVYDVPTP